MTTTFTASIIGALAMDLNATVPHRTNPAIENLPATADDPALMEILDYIDTHLGECELGEQSIRHRFKLSRATLYRRFQTLGGVANYIRERRLQLAYRHLTHNPACSLTWLLYEIGFASERQFQRSFMARFGMSAANWRRNCQAC